MKATNYFKDVKFTIIVTEGTHVSREKFMTLDRIFNSGKEEGDDFEFIYSLNDRFEDVIKMKVGDSMAFKSDRNENWTSLIVRTQ